MAAPTATGRCGQMSGRPKSAASATVPIPPLQWRGGPACLAAAAQAVHWKPHLTGGRRTEKFQFRVAAVAAEGAAAVADDPATAFDWQLCLALAGCAFEAYNDIEADAPSLKMTSMGGTEIKFVNEDFLRHKFAGLMEVTVKSGKGLPIADWWLGAKSDPYAVLNIGDSAAATAVVQQNLEPQWAKIS